MGTENNLVVTSGERGNRGGGPKKGLLWGYMKSQNQDCETVGGNCKEP